MEHRSLFPSDEDRKDPAWYAPNGGMLYAKNLNANSTHPNPWRPSTIFEANMPAYENKLNLLTWNQPVFKAQKVQYEDDGLGEKLAYYNLKAVVMGNVFAIWDLNIVKTSKALPFMGKVARWGYIVSPWVAMCTTWITTHHCINKMVKKPNEPWIYGISWFSPAVVWGTYKMSFGSFGRVFFVGGVAHATYKAMMDAGLGGGDVHRYVNVDGSGLSTMNDPVHGTAKQSSRWANWWQGGDQPSRPLRNFDEEWYHSKWQIEPSWKKHIPEEDRNKGPPTGL